MHQAKELAQSLSVQLQQERQAHAATSAQAEEHRHQAEKLAVYKYVGHWFCIIFFSHVYDKMCMTTSYLFFCTNFFDVHFALHILIIIDAILLPSLARNLSDFAVFL